MNLNFHEIFVDSEKEKVLDSVPTIKHEKNKTKQKKTTEFWINH